MLKSVRYRRMSHSKFYPSITKHSICNNLPNYLGETKYQQCVNHIEFLLTVKFALFENPVFP